MGESQTVQQAKTLDQTTDPSTCKALMQGRATANAKPGVSFYALKAGALSSTDMGVGIVDAPANLVVVGGVAQVDLDRDSKNEVFSSCATSEGIKFAVWAGKAYQGEPLWSGYNYLGYDLEPNCP